MGDITPITSCSKNMMEVWKYSTLLALGASVGAITGDCPIEANGGFISVDEPTDVF